MRDRTLLAQRFNLETLQVEGTPAAVTGESLEYHPAGFALFSCSREGVLAIGTGSLASTLQWMHRSGRATPAIAGMSEYASVRLSPDGQQILYGLPYATTGNQDIWVYSQCGGGPDPTQYSCYNEFVQHEKRANVTVALSADLLRRARHLAVERGLSLSALLAEELERLVETDQRYAHAKLRAQTRMEKGVLKGLSRQITWTRDELHERR